MEVVGQWQSRCQCDAQSLGHHMWERAVLTPRLTRSCRSVSGPVLHSVNKQPTFHIVLPSSALFSAVVGHRRPRSVVICLSLSLSLSLSLEFSNFWISRWIVLSNFNWNLHFFSLNLNFWIWIWISRWIVLSNFNWNSHFLV